MLWTPLRRVPWLMAVAMFAAPAALCPPDSVAAQPSNRAHITVAPTIVAKGASEAVLAIEVGPAHMVPPGSFLSLGGLPKGVSLTEAHLVSPGAWAIPLSALPTVRAWIAADVSGRAKIVIRLLAMDGGLLAQATTTLVIEPARVQEAVPSKPKQSRSIPVAPQPPSPNARQERTKQSGLGQPKLAPQDGARAGHLLTRGLNYLAAGNVLAARDFFERAAELGLAAAALRLAATYDPVELQRLQVTGIVPDRTLARRWYEVAKELGAPEAASRLARLRSGN